MSAVKLNLFNYSRPMMRELLAQYGESTFRADQIIKWIHQHQVLDFAAMSNLSKDLRSKLSELFECQAPSVVTQQVSKDGTCKWLLRLGCGNKIETVFIPEAKRGTLCVSSQVGCSLNCSFCATGAQGFNRNLSIAEIIGQVYVANAELKKIDASKKITNVVMMGMGEPLLNYDNVLASMDLMLDDYAYGLSKYRVTLSTSGLVPIMQKLRHDSPVALAVSLHAPFDELRNKLVPLNKKYPLKDLLQACRDYFSRDSKRKITMEYVMLANTNDSLECAKQLAKILRGIPCKINLIPFNPYPNAIYKCSSASAITNFKEFLMKQGYIVNVRTPRGEDIAGACGQLRGEFYDKTVRSRIIKSRNTQINLQDKVS